MLIVSDVGDSKRVEVIKKGEKVFQIWEAESTRRGFNARSILPTIGVKQLDRNQSMFCSKE